MQNDAESARYSVRIQSALRGLDATKSDFAHSGTVSFDGAKDLPGVSVHGFGRIRLPICVRDLGEYACFSYSYSYSCGRMYILIGLSKAKAEAIGALVCLNDNMCMCLSCVCISCEGLCITCIMCVCIMCVCSMCACIMRMCTWMCMCMYMCIMNMCIMYAYYV
jgi:hypothetical protein